MSRNRRIGGAITILLVVLLLAACCGATNTTTPQVKKPTPTPSPTPGQGAQVLATMAQKINSATTLHGIFDVKITGQALNGSVNSEIWNATPNKNRTVVLQSTVTQFPVGSVTVTNGKQTWQYDPAKKVVYTGAVTPSNGSPSSGGQSQFILNIVQTVFTHSNATLVPAGATVNGHAAYDVHVESQGQTPGTSGTGSFNYAGDVYIDKATNLPLRVNLTLQGFGRVQLDLPTLVLNQPIPDSTFTFIVPAGVKVLPLQQSSPTTGTGSLTLTQAQQQAGYHLLSIPSTQTDYQLISVNALGALGSQIYTLNYTKGSTNITLAEGKPLANLPASGGQHLSLRGTTGTVATSNGSTTLTWTEHGIGLNLTAPLSSDQLLAIAKQLS
jgi:outer membrane lipoprotein-sorting protein